MANIAPEAIGMPVGRRMGDGAVGVIDVGSNSVRLVLYERGSRAPATLFNEKVLAALGEGLSEAGRLSDEAMERALDAIRRFLVIAQSADAKSLTIVATAAARVAANGPEFIKEIEALTGVPVRVLAGSEEAEMAAYGVLCGFWRPDGVVGDLGGGSLELIDIGDDRLGAGESYALGTLRLKNDSGGSLGEAATIVSEQLAGSRQLTLQPGRAFYAVGGTWRSLVRLHMAMAHYPISVMHHYTVPAEEMAEFCARVITDGIDSFREANVVSKARRGLVSWGAVVLRQIIARGQPSEIIASALGVREGVIFSALSPYEQERDPLLLASEELAILRARSPQNCAELISWTSSVFAALGIRESDDERRLRAAACLMSDIGWRAHPDYRGDQAIAIITNMALYGIDHPGRGYLASALHDRYGGMADGAARPAAEALCLPRLAQRAKILAAAFKVAYVLAPGVAGVLPRTRVHFEDETLVLWLPKDLAALQGERPQRRLRSLARLVNAGAAIVVEGEERALDEAVS
ncbi:MAG: exopolyphosphatase [Acuticoccus sp.]